MAHTIISGGALHVPEDLYDELLGVYGREIQRGNATLAYSEKRSSDVFRMYFDLDILDRATLGDAEVLAIVSVLEETVTQFFPNAPDKVFKCVRSRSKTKEVELAVKCAA
ncbi:unnamed protein product, partial [Pylaiella littoralis]